MPLKSAELLCVGVALTMLACSERSIGQVAPGSADAGGQAGDVAGDRPGTDDVSSTASLLQTIDDMDHTDDGYPALPAGSSAFFWRSPSSPGIGNWFVSSADRTSDAHIDAIVPPRGDSKKACHVSGSQHDRGIDLWAQLDHPGGRPVDLGSYAGIAFWARLNSPSSKLVVAVGSEWFAAQTGQASLPAWTLAVPDEWIRFVLPFDELGVDASAVASIDFVVGDGGESFDLWIDDLALLCRGVCP